MVVLVDERGHCLLHGTDDETILPRRDRPGTRPPVWQFPVLGPERDGCGCGTYEDPVDRQTYLAGYARLDRTGWVAWVQQDQGAMAALAEDYCFPPLVAMGLVALAAYGALVTGLWGWLVWTVRRQERAAHV
jgi:hypothetical protein